MPETKQEKPAPLPAPNYTQVPNAVLDSLPEFGDAEIRVLLALVRALTGWHRIEDDLSLSQLETLTGLSRQGVLNGINGLEAKGWIQVTRSRSINRYRLNVEKPATPPRPPAADVYREVFHRWPARPQWALLEEVQDLDRFRQICLEWLASGYRPTNLAGILDWYAGRGTPKNGKVFSGAGASEYDKASIE